MLKRFAFAVFVLTFSVAASAQTSSRLVNLASKAYAEGDYFTAAKLYEQYLNPASGNNKSKGLVLYNNLSTAKKGSGKRPDKLEVVFQLAQSYRLSYFYVQAAEHYKNCFEANPAKFGDAYYWYAVCYRSIGNYKEARNTLITFLDKHAAGSALKSAAETELQTLNFIQTQISRPDTILYKVKKADQVIGVEKGVYAATSAGDKKVIVTSTIKDPTVKKGKNPYRNRLFVAEESSDNTFQGIEELKIESLDKDANQGTAAVHPSGNILYFTQWVKDQAKSKSALYYSRLKDGKWMKPELLPNINQEGFNTKQPTLTSDGKTIYFTSDRPGGAGGFDIWSASVDSNGIPSKAVNLGKVINTPGEEQAPYFHQGRKVLIFASNSRPGMGGFDLYVTSNEVAKWSEPQNLGYPVNSTRDDIYYYNSSEDLMRNAYLSSDRGSNCCLETYNIQKLPKQRRIIGQLLDCKGSIPMADAEVELNTGSGNKVKTDENGKFAFELQEKDKPEDLVFSKDAYIAKTTAFKVSQVDDKDPLLDVWVNETVCIDPVEVIKPENISPIYFDFDKAKLLKDGRKVLDSVYNILAANPTYSIKVDAHTDSKGSKEYNIKLSKRRADAVVNYLVKKGIEASRITYEAFGKCCPVEEDMPGGVYNKEVARKNRRALVHITKP
ncbi:MAG: OmpA family protein [Bacteroidetes bacterium]|nr:OmpA family protein [Bacteroidota bacterium]